jgi:hypothetical protein
VGLAVAWTASYWLLLMPAFWYAGRPIQLGVGAIIGAIWKFVLASILAAWGCVLAVRQLPSLGATAGSVGALERIITTSLVFGVLYLSAVILLHGGGKPIYRLGELLGELAPGKKSSNSIPAVSACAGNDGSVANG